ncbi:uncharacterized protein MKZ38_005777 [Zalerion maritima]|uniref:Small-subunit processome Utp12 domain-containing protein n=1 Tax=Zalerion maritima TaxID=339359 RepID=A0AAD5RKN7_9PEZI|nr:uncharacterized protein MKZ38_005777 [Zalerion maritima]
MKTDYKFSDLLGTVYHEGNLLFNPEGTHLFSPVGNRVTVFDLVNNKTFTLPFAHRKNIARLGLTPRGDRLLSIDDQGKAIFTDVARRITTHHISFNTKPTALSFSPNGKYFAVALGRRVEVWEVPPAMDTDDDDDMDIGAMKRHHRHMQHFDDVKEIEWSGDSKFFLTASKDLTARIWSVNSEENFVYTVLSGHKQGVVGAWFSDDQETIYTVSKDGAVFTWQYNEKWEIVGRHYFMQGSAYVQCAAYHADKNLLVAGYSNGVFALYEMPDFTQIHTLSISRNEIDCVTINKTGEWLAFGASKLGQLLVWEWQSESYILKQQGHLDSMNALVYSPDGKRIATTADDGKIKIWDVESGFCIFTFTDHTSGVTGCEWARKGNVLFTSSLDGSVRAWDLIRSRNFRTLTTPTRLSFSCLAVDPAGEVVAAGSLDSFDIHLWRVETGQLLDRLSGHEGPVSSLAFSPNGDSLVSGSWDKTARIWNIFSRTQTSEPLQLQSDVLDVSFRPDSQQVAISTLDGQLSFWDVAEATQVALIDGRRDISGGRSNTDRRTAANALGNKAFNTIAYSTDGHCLLAGGNSKYICLYSVLGSTLVKKFTVSVNLALAGTQEFLNSKNMTEAGPLDLVDDEASDAEGQKGFRLPGSRRGGDPGQRQNSTEVKVSGLSFSPSGTSFCAASTEGLLIYSVDTDVTFDPYDLDITITRKTVLATLREQRDFPKAMAMAFRLNQSDITKAVFLSIPHGDVKATVSQLPPTYMPRLIRFVAGQMESSPDFELCMMWLQAIANAHGPWLTANRRKASVQLRLGARAIGIIRDQVRKLVDGNRYTSEYLSMQVPEADEMGGVMPASVFQPGLDQLMDSDDLESQSESEWDGLD